MGCLIKSLTWSGLLGAPWGVMLTVRVLSLQYSAVARPLTALSTALCWAGPSPAALRWEQSWAYWVAQAAHLLARLIATAKSCMESEFISLATLHVTRPVLVEHGLQCPYLQCLLHSCRGCKQEEAFENQSLAKEGGLPGR